MLFEISKRISRNVVRVLLKIEHNFYKFYSNAFLTTRTGFLEMLFNQVECVCIVCVSCVSVLVPLNLSNRISRNSVRLLKNFFYRQENTLNPDFVYVQHNFQVVFPLLIVHSAQKEYKRVKILHAGEKVFKKHSNRIFRNPFRVLLQVISLHKINRKEVMNTG